MAASRDPATKAVISLDIGFRFTVQDQSLRRINVRATDRFAVDQAVKQVQNMGLGCHAFCQRHLCCDQYSLLIVVQDQRQDIDHFPISTWSSQHVIL